MLSKYKGKLISNSLSVFNYYKGLAGRSLEKDIHKVESRAKILDDPNSTDEELDAAYDSDPMELLQGIYFAMRCAAEHKDLDYSEVQSEINIEDLSTGQLLTEINKMFKGKKLPEQKGAKKKIFA